MSLPAGDARPPSRLARFVLMVWATFLCLVCGTYLGSHLVALPQPEAQDPQLVAAVTAQRGLDGIGEWMVVHALYGECPCSRKIADTLLDPSRPRPEGVAETMLLVGADEELRLRASEGGFAVVTVPMDRLKTDWGIAAAPLMVVADPTDRIRYVGGYTSRKQGPDVRDLAILTDLQANTEVAALPLFGCAVSQTLAAIVDPLGLR